MNRVYEVFNPKMGIKEYIYESPYVAVEKAADDYNTKYDYQIVRGGPVDFGVRVKGSKKSFMWIRVEAKPITLFNLSGITELDLSEPYMKNFASFAKNNPDKVLYAL